MIPQFVTPAHGSTWSQFLQLGAVQVVVAVTVNALIVLTAAAIAGYLAAHPRVLAVQRYTSGAVLGWFASRMAVSRGAGFVRWFLVAVVALSAIALLGDFRLVS